MPASDGFVSHDELEQTDPRYPLELAFCDRCTLVQVLETVVPGQLFGENYLYFSSCSDSWLSHARKNAGELINRYDLGGKSLVLEPASNDGYLLRQFAAQGIPVLGVDPAPGPVAAAREKGIETIREFFTEPLARELAGAGVQADLVITNNVLAHVADLHDFIRGINAVLKPRGAWIIEVPYVRDLVDAATYDTIYHEHLCYFSVRALKLLLESHGFTINDIRLLRSHGGSLRLYASRQQGTCRAVAESLRQEERQDLHGLAPYRDFAYRAVAIRDALAELLDDLAARNEAIAAYGAAAKGTMLLNSLGSAATHVAFAVDRNPLKQGKWIPGVRIPILAPEAIESEKPAYLLLLPWNLQHEVLTQQAAYRAGGGKFIIPFPGPTVV
jgi:SAM-dependent methyltransferase